MLQWGRLVSSGTPASSGKIIPTMESKELLDNFTYPSDFMRIVDQNLTDLDPWSILFGDLLKVRSSGLKLRYPYRSVVPFAQRCDNDDVACFEEGIPGKVIIIHDYASQGWEGRQSFDSFWDWFKQAIDDMIEYER